MKKLFSFFAAILVAGSMWGAATTIFDAADAGWSANGVVLTSGTTTVGDVTWYGGGSATIDNGATVDGVKWDNRLKFGGSSTIQVKNGAENLSRVLKYIAPSAGTIKVYAVTGSNSSDRYVLVSQSLTATNRDESTALVKQNTNPASVATATVTAGPVYIWADNNIGIYGVTFEASTKTVVSETCTGIKKDGVAVDPANYTESEGVFTFNDSYMTATAPEGYALVNHITYSDSSTEDKDVAAEFALVDNYWVATKTFGEQTVTIRVPFDTTIVYNWNTVGTTTLVGTAAVGTVKIKNVDTNGIKFGNSFSAANYLKIESRSEGEGFKAGDVISWTGCINNKDATKQGAIMIVKIEAADTTVLLACSELFNNTYDASVEPTSGSFVLTEDATSLYIGRANSGLSGATATWLTQLTVTRPVIALNAEGYATFSCSFNAHIVGAKVYKAALNGNVLHCTEVESGKVPAGTGVLLAGEADATFKALYVESAEAIEDNALLPTTLADGSLATLESCLVLNDNEFVTYTGTEFVAGKAYLPYAATAPVRIEIPGSNPVATGMENAALNIKATKALKDGKIVILRGDRMFNLNGMLVK